MRGFPTQEQVNKIKERYPISTVIELTADMNDTYNPIPKGMRGEVIGIDDIGTLHMKRQNGSGLGVVVGEDSFQVISKPEPEITEPTYEIGGMSL